MKKMENISLPEAFVEKMSRLLGDGAGNFFESYERERSFGLRVNPLKAGERLPGLLSGLERIPWSREGFYYPEELRPGKHPLHEAGAYYIQEPSAQACAEALDPRPGERILDLCAAPGGKSTHLAGKMEQKGLLVCNEIHPARAKILSQNIERMGIGNAVVTNMEPAGLVPGFREFFDGIAVDAPCSGEGMFRKDENARLEWSPAQVAVCAARQDQILDCAAAMVRPGGRILYSTCTFAPKEDEGVVSYLLENRPDMKLMELPAYEGFATGVPAWGNGDPALSRCVHLFPHKMQGEGHFMALFRKEGRTDLIGQFSYAKPNPDTRKWLELFFQEIGLKTLGGQPFDWNRVETRKDKVYYLPPVTGDFRGLTFLRNGLYLGDLKKNRFEPSEPFALALRKDDTDGIISLSVNDQRLTRYLKGETLNIEQGEAAHTKGWHLLCVEGYPLGFGKLVGNTFKNKYPAGWRV